MKQLAFNNTPTLSDKFLTVLYENTYLSDREKEYLLAIMEMTKEETYRWNRFKDRYHVTPKDKNGDRELTLNGQRVKVHEPKDDKVISSNQAGDLNINIEKLCMIPNDNEIDAVMQHEDGHRKLHTLNPNSKALDKKRTDVQLRADVAREITLRSLSGERIHDDAIANTILKLVNVPMTSKNMKKKDAELVEKRKRFREKMRQNHLVPDTYADVNEFEADQYAANKVGKDTLIRALRSMDSLDKKYEELDIKRGLAKDPDRDYEELHKRHLKDTDIRANALNDTRIDMALRRSLSD